MLNFLKRLFGENSKPEKSIPDPDFTLLIANIKKREENLPIQPGKKIHEFDYALYTLRLDRDITENYRVTVFQGNERVYSFTVFASQSKTEKLEEAYKEIISFLKSEQNITDLPNSNLLKGFFYGH